MTEKLENERKFNNEFCMGCIIGQVAKGWSENKPKMVC